MVDVVEDDDIIEIWDKEDIKRENLILNMGKKSIIQVILK